jgi:hypothetical protein
MQRMFHRSVSNDTEQLKQQTRISNLDSEVSVVVVHDFRDHQRCISDHNSPKNHSITNLKRTLLRLLKHEECLTGLYETKPTMCSRKQQIPTWIQSFRSWLYMIFVTTNDAYLTITPLKITQLQI